MGTLFCIAKIAWKLGPAKCCCYVKEHCQQVEVYGGGDHTSKVLGPYKQGTRTIYVRYWDHTSKVLGPHNQGTGTIQARYWGHASKVLGLYKQGTETIYQSTGTSLTRYGDPLVRCSYPGIRIRSLDIRILLGPKYESRIT